MQSLTFALLTPSYRGDFERRQFLCESVSRFVKPPCKHYLIIDKRDTGMFSHLKGRYTELVSVESVLPWWIMRLPFARRWWLSLKTPPIRNWILQQLVKLSSPCYTSEDVLVFVDSDVAFVRPFDLRSLVRDGKVRLFDVPGEGNFGEHHAYNRVAGKLLGLPPSDYYGSKYIGNAITWRRENVLKLHEHLNNRWKRPWLNTIPWQLTLSEYVLYGVFNNHVLKDGSGHYTDPQKICHEYWTAASLSQEKLAEFLGKIEPQHVSVMISAKAGMPVSSYSQFLKDIR